MHYCAQVITPGVASVVAVADDAVTCESLGYTDVQLPGGAVLLPKMSSSEGALLAVAIITPWLMSWAIGAIISVFRPNTET